MDLFAYAPHVVFSNLNSVFRQSQKQYDKEYSNLLGRIKDLKADSNDILKQLADVREQLQGLKETQKQNEKVEKELVDLLEEQITFVTTIIEPSLDPNDVRTRSLISRLVVDYLVRNWLVDEASEFARLEGIEHDVRIELELFTKLQPVAMELMRGRYQDAMKWCAVNRTKLKKIKSKLEFRLCVAAYLELLVKGMTDTAMKYLREHVASRPFVEDHAAEISALTALLALDPTVAKQHSRYQELFSEQRWRNLAGELLHDACEINGMCTTAPLYTAIAAGIPPLKTPMCGEKSCSNVECPICNEAAAPLSAQLPTSHHGTSRLVCALTGKVMDADDPPHALPNGQVYSSRALQEMAKMDKGQVTCVITGEKFPIEQCRRVYTT